MMTSAQIRRQFIDFFVQKHGHTFVPSSPVVPLDDPTLLFTNAGMNQFKPIFLGTEKRRYTRATNTQKCIRASGKQNDLDDVGRSRRHHTFFEMLGNWSFGDYFKQGAIEMAWELLTKVWKLDPTRLHVSCFEGDEKNGVPRDTDAAEIWKRVAGLPDDHIHYFGKDNFWEMGETGPCGPCTEIYIDRTPNKTGGADVNGDDPRVMEIWNLVFIQYNRNPDRSLSVLPSQHVDTGMGLERIAQVLQDKHDNYAIDLWEPFFAALTGRTDIRYTGKFTANNTTDPQAEAADTQLRNDIALRVIADHLRAMTFAITDGAVPENKGRGSVLRGIIRRAGRFGWQQLGLHQPFLYSLVPVVVDTMGEAFPELRKDPKRVMEIVRDEEETFGRTLERGLELFADAASRAGDSVISGRDMFELHTTYGFFPDLTRVMAREKGLSVDEAGYKKLFEEFQEQSGQKLEVNSGLLTLPPAALAKLHHQSVKPTDDSAKFNAMPMGAAVKAIWDGSRLIEQTHGAEAAERGVAVILDQTNFYAEMGGQVGDTGELRSRDGAVMAVETTRASGGYVLHVGNVEAGHLRVGDHVTATLAGVRPRTEKNHTATHLTNWALREVLGEGVQQKGSLVDPDKLRFDFSHGKPISEEEVAKVEGLVGERVNENLPVFAEESPQEQALKINGLRAVFGEKYPPVVRVVSIGAPVKELLKNPSDPKWRQYSIEFCGGTHLRTTGDVGAFVVTGEELVSKGVRRIFALTGDAAREVLERGRSMETMIAEARAVDDCDLAGRIATLQQSVSAGELPLRARRRVQAVIAELQDRHKKWEKVSRAQSAAKIDVGEVAGKLLASASTLGPGKLIVGDVPGATQEQLLSVTDSLKKQAGSYGILLGSANHGKVSFVAAVSDDLIAKGLKAGDWIREAAKATGGGGGGRPQMAQAGGKDPAKLLDALKVAREYAASVEA
jgi:alanyl-tRNA synthetase